MAKKKFKAKIVKEGTGLGWRIVDLPFDVKKAFGSAGRVPVRGTVNGFAFRSSLFPRKTGVHFLMLNKTMQRGANATNFGDEVEVVLEQDDDERTVSVPPELEDALEADDDLRSFYDSFNYSTRKWLADAVSAPKSAPSRERRAEKLAIQLIEIREGLQRIPPILQQAFASVPKARTAWEALADSHKQRHLFRIFLTNNPDMQRKRAEETVDRLMAKGKDIRQG